MKLLVTGSEHTCLEASTSDRVGPYMFECRSSRRQLYCIVSFKSCHAFDYVSVIVPVSNSNEKLELKDDQPVPHLQELTCNSSIQLGAIHEGSYNILLDFTRIFQHMFRVRYCDRSLSSSV